MKMLLYIVAGVLLTSVMGLSDVGLVTEKGDPEVGKNMWTFESEWEVVAQQKNWNSSKSNTSGAVSISGGKGDEGQTPQMQKNFNSAKSNTSAFGVTKKPGQVCFSLNAKESRGAGEKFKRKGSTGRLSPGVRKVSRSMLDLMGGQNHLTEIYTSCWSTVMVSCCKTVEVTSTGVTSETTCVNL